jgi:hypothetical protein
MITFVSILASNSSDVVGWENRLEQLGYLLYSELPLVLYVDAFYRSKITMPVPPNVKLLTWVPEQTRTFQEADKYPVLNRGHNRNDQKDTRYYCTLMNSKMEMVMKAVDDGHVQTSHVAYIDAGIAKLFQEKQASFQRLKTLNSDRLGVDRIIAPGSWPPNILTTTIDDMYENVSWVFSGSLLLGSVEKMRWFSEKTWEVYLQMLSRGYILWETNVWCVVIAGHKDDFFWYAGHHCDDLTRIPL